MKPGTLSLIKIIKFRDIITEGFTWPDEPFVYDLRSFDIPETISKMIMRCPKNLIAISLSPKGGPKMVKSAEHAARKKGIRILWWTGLKGTGWGFTNEECGGKK